MGHINQSADDRIAAMPRVARKVYIHDGRLAVEFAPNRRMFPDRVIAVVDGVRTDLTPEPGEVIELKQHVFCVFSEPDKKTGELKEVTGCL